MEGEFTCQAPFSPAFHYLRLLTRESAALHFCASSHPPMAAHKARARGLTPSISSSSKVEGWLTERASQGGCKGHAGPGFNLGSSQPREC